jgi:hypothetical protein
MLNLNLCDTSNLSLVLWFRFTIREVCCDLYWGLFERRL